METHLLSHPPLAAGTWEVFSAGLPHLAGMVVVLATLACLWGICVATGKVINTLFPRAEPATPAPAPVASPRAETPSPADEDPARIPPEIVAVIAAAVHTAVGKGHRVVSVRAQDTTWEQAGRQAVLGSHRIR